ncbi:MAG TPA: response regulator transcription factor [Spirochaetia bacterium]|nr:response regulator transcription factor [Spirochaetia bacterium]
MKQRVLVVEDDPAILTGLVDLLEAEGFAVEQAVTGPAALARHAGAAPDLVLLDVMIPEKSGYDVCREIRRKDPVTPIIMLTAKGQEIDRVIGLELGADDYVVKPFGANELVARIRAVLRRGRPRQGPADQKPVSFGEVTVDPRTMRGARAGRPFDVSRRELALLQLFVAREGQALDRFTIMDEVWGVRYEGTTRTLDQHVAGLRKKVEADPAHPRHITTVHGVGYRFTSEP